MTDDPDALSALLVVAGLFSSAPNSTSLPYPSGVSARAMGILITGGLVSVHMGEDGNPALTLTNDGLRQIAAAASRQACSGPYAAIHQ